MDDDAKADAEALFAQSGVIAINVFIRQAVACLSRGWKPCFSPPRNVAHLRKVSGGHAAGRDFSRHEPIVTDESGE
jgi:hypothetical protein